MHRRALLLALALSLCACDRGARSARRFELRALGRDGAALHYDATPGRILAANAAALDYLAALVEPGSFVALPETAATYSSVPMDAPGWSGLPELVDYTAEAVLTFEPELVVAHAWQDANATRVLRSAGVGVVELPDVVELEDAYSILRALGELLHASERAEREIATLEARRAALAQRVPAAKPSALVYSNFGTGGWTAGAETAEDLVLRLAGLENAAQRAGLAKHEPIDVERLLAIDPEVLVVCASGEDSELSGTRAYLAGEKLLQPLRALKSGRVVVLPVRLYSTTSQHVLDAAEAVRAQLDALR